MTKKERDTQMQLWLSIFIKQPKYFFLCNRITVVKLLQLQPRRLQGSAHWGKMTFIVFLVTELNQSCCLLKAATVHGPGLNYLNAE